MEHKSKTLYLNKARDSKHRIVLPTIQIGIFFDGTGNNAFGPPAGMSNIGKLWYAYREDDAFVARDPSKKYNYENPLPIPRIRKFYVRGVGTEKRRPEDDLHETWSAKTTTGMITGAYGHERLSHAHHYIRSVIEEYEEVQGCLPFQVTLDVFGFSRGASLARHFVNMIRTSEGRASTLFSSDAAYVAKVKDLFKVRFLGVYDTVGSFGMAGDDVDKGFDFSISKHQVQYCYHLTAQDEIRESFDLQSLKKDPTDPDEIHTGTDSWILEEEMDGVHADIGGAYRDSAMEHAVDNIELAKVCLHKMYDKSLAIGVPWHTLTEIAKLKVYSKASYDSDGDIEDGDAKDWKAYSLWTYWKSDSEFLQKNKELEVFKIRMEGAWGTSWKHYYKLWKNLIIQEELIREHISQGLWGRVEDGVLESHSASLNTLRFITEDSLNEIHRKQRLLQSVIQESGFAKDAGLFDETIRAFHNSYMHRSHAPFNETYTMWPQVRENIVDHYLVNTCLGEQASAFAEQTTVFYARDIFPIGSQVETIKKDPLKPAMASKYLAMYLRILVKSGTRYDGLHPQHEVVLEDGSDNLLWCYGYGGANVPFSYDNDLSRKAGLVRLFIWKDDLKDSKTISFEILHKYWNYSSEQHNCILQEDGSLTKGRWKTSDKRIGTQRQPVEIVIAKSDL